MAKRSRLRHPRQRLRRAIVANGRRDGLLPVFARSGDSPARVASMRLRISGSSGTRNATSKPSAAASSSTESIVAISVEAHANARMCVSGSQEGQHAEERADKRDRREPRQWRPSARSCRA
jgi:hypothetical protein